MIAINAIHLYLFLCVFLGDNIKKRKNITIKLLCYGNCINQNHHNSWWPITRSFWLIKCLYGASSWCSVLLQLFVKVDLVCQCGVPCGMESGWLLLFSCVLCKRRYGNCIKGAWSHHSWLVFTCKTIKLNVRASMFLHEMRAFNFVSVSFWTFRLFAWWILRILFVSKTVNSPGTWRTLGPGIPKPSIALNF